MYQIDNSTAATTMPAPGGVGPNPGGFFTAGSPASATPATVVDADWLNALQQEIINVLVAAGISPSKTADNQMAAAIPKLVPSGYQAVQASTNFVVPDDVYVIQFEGWGAGGGGGSSAGNTSGGSGGSGAAYARGAIAVTPGQTIPITIGAGGVPAAAGGTTTIGTYATLAGGGAGLTGNNTYATSGSGAGGTASVSGVIGAFIASGQQGYNAYGFASSPGTTNNTRAGDGGWAFGGSTSRSSIQLNGVLQNGLPATSCGCGGGGGYNGGSGANGADGCVNLWW